MHDGENAKHQCVIIMLSGPLRSTLAPFGPAILASRDCAHVAVMCGRDEVPSGDVRHRPRKAGGDGLIDAFEAGASNEGLSERMNRCRFSVEPNARGA